MLTYVNNGRTGVADGRRRQALFLEPGRRRHRRACRPAGTEELAKNPVKEVIMSTPAISDGVLIVRTLGHVYGIGAAK